MNSHNTRNESITINDYWIILKKWKWKIILLPLALTLITQIILFFVPKTYKSEATLKIPAIPISSYNKLKSQIFDINNLKHIFERVKIKEKFIYEMRSKSDVEKYLKMTPISESGKENIEQFMENEKVIGINVLSYAPNPEISQKIQEELFFLIRSIWQLDKLNETVDVNLFESLNFLKETNEHLIEHKININSLKEKLVALQEIEKSYKDASPTRTQMREIVDVSGGGDRFLPIKSQIIGLLSEIADLEKSIRIYDNQIKYHNSLMTLWKQFDRILIKNGDISRQNYLELLQKEKDLFFKEKEIKDDILLAVRKNIETNFDIINNLWDGFVQIYGPILPLFPVKPSRVRFFFIVLFSSFMSIVFLSFLLEAFKVSQDKA